MFYSSFTREWQRKVTSPDSYGADENHVENEPIFCDLAPKDVDDGSAYICSDTETSSDANTDGESAMQVCQLLLLLLKSSDTLARGPALVIFISYGDTHRVYIYMGQFPRKCPSFITL